MEVKFLSSLSLDNYKDISNEIYENIKQVKNQYPNFDKWFGKVLIELDGINREIIFIKDEEILKGFIILKNTIEEKKICGIFVKEDYRKNGIGSLLIKEGIKFLNEDKPIITISTKNVEMFKSFIEKYNWVQTSIFYGYYSPEVIFNEKRKD